MTRLERTKAHQVQSKTGQKWEISCKKCWTSYPKRARLGRPKYNKNPSSLMHIHHLYCKVRHFIYKLTAWRSAIAACQPPIPADCYINQWYQMKKILNKRKWRHFHWMNTWGEYPANNERREECSNISAAFGNQKNRMNAGNYQKSGRYERKWRKYWGILQ